MSFSNTAQYNMTPDLYLSQSSTKRAQKGGNLLTNLGWSTHLIEQGALTGKQVYPEVKYRNGVGKNEIAIRFLGN